MSNGRAYSVSPTLMSWQVEKSKQYQGLPNEIDAAEIQAALQGYLNSWTTAVRQNPELFRKVDGKSWYNWEQIKHLKGKQYVRG
jgi:hypothetical protein